MLQEQCELTAKVWGWKASFQRGLGAQYCRTDRYCFLSAHLDCLVWKSWNSPMHKAFCPSRCFFYQPYSSFSTEETSAGKSTWESHLHITPEAEKLCFQLQHESNPELRQNLHYIHFDSQAFSFSSFTFALPTPLPHDKDIRGWAVTFSTSHQISHLPDLVESVPAHGKGVGLHDL